MFSGIRSLGEVCQPAWSSTRTTCAPSVMLRLMELLLVETETAFDYFQSTRAYLERMASR